MSNEKKIAKLAGMDEPTEPGEEQVALPRPPWSDKCKIVTPKFDEQNPKTVRCIECGGWVMWKDQGDLCGICWSGM